MDELNRTLRDQAIDNGLCGKWQRMWSKGWSKERMVDRFFNGINFCIEHHWPDNGFIKENFEKGFLRHNNILVDDTFSLLNPEMGVILGKSEAKVRYNAGNIGIVHIRDDSYVMLTARNRSFVIVHLYENARIKADSFDKAKLTVIKHSNTVSIDAGERVNVVEEYDWPPS